MDAATAARLATSSFAAATMHTPQVCASVVGQFAIALGPMTNAGQPSPEPAAPAHPDPSEPNPEPGAALEVAWAEPGPRTAVSAVAGPTVRAADLATPQR